MKREFAVLRRAFISQPLRPCTTRSQAGTVNARFAATAPSDDVVDVALLHLGKEDRVTMKMMLGF